MGREREGDEQLALGNNNEKEERRARGGEKKGQRKLKKKVGSKVAFKRVDQCAYLPLVSLSANGNRELTSKSDFA